MAEVGSRAQFGALRKVLQPGEPAVCLPEPGGPRRWSCPTPRLRRELWERPLRAHATRGGGRKTHFARCLRRGWDAEGTGQRSYLESTESLHLLSVDI